MGAVWICGVIFGTLIVTKKLTLQKMQNKTSNSNLQGIGGGIKWRGRIRGPMSPVLNTNKTEEQMVTQGPFWQLAEALPL